MVDGRAFWPLADGLLLIVGRLLVPAVGLEVVVPCGRLEVADVGRPETEEAGRLDMLPDVPPLFRVLADAC